MCLCLLLQTGDRIKHKIHIKGNKEPIVGYFVNPELEQPFVIVDFPTAYKEWMESKGQKDISEQDTQRIDDSSSKASTSTRSTRSKGPGSSPGGSVSPPSKIRRVEKTHVVPADSEEDDVAAELPDGFYSTSREFIIHSQYFIV